MRKIITMADAPPIFALLLVFAIAGAFDVLAVHALRPGSALTYSAAGFLSGIFGWLTARAAIGGRQ